MIEKYEQINDILAVDFYEAGLKEKDELVKFEFYWQALANLYVKYATSSSGERKMLQDYLAHEEVMDLLYEKIDLNDHNLDIFLEYPVFDTSYNPNKDKEFYVNKKLPDNWGMIHNETDKSIKNFQIIYSILGFSEEREFEEVMQSLFTTIYKLYNNVVHTYYGVIDDVTKKFVISSAEILDKVLKELLDLRRERKI